MSSATIEGEGVQEIPAACNVESAAALVGIPRRTMYSYVRQNLVPVTRLTPNRVCLTKRQVRRLRAVVEAEGRAGIREGLLIQN